MTVGGKKCDDSLLSDYLTKTGTVEVIGKVTDSRGYYKANSNRITVIPYSNPMIQAVSGEDEVIATRCDKDGNLSDSGTYLRIKAKRVYSPVISDGTQNNFCGIRYRYKAENGSYSSWETILAPESLDSDEIVTDALDCVLLPTKSYVVQVGVIDGIGNAAYTTIDIPTERVYLHKAGSLHSIGVGMYVNEENMVDVAEDITTRFRGEVLIGGEDPMTLKDYILSVINEGG